MQPPDCNTLNLQWNITEAMDIFTQIKVLPSHSKACMYGSIVRQIAQLAADRILTDNLPKTCTAATFPCQHTDSHCQACLRCSALMENEWTPSD